MCVCVCVKFEVCARAEIGGSPATNTAAMTQLTVVEGDQHREERRTWGDAPLYE